MKIFNLLTTAIASLLTLPSLTLGNPIPDTTDMTPNNTNATEDALFSDYYIWCGSVALTLDCSSPPNNYECQTNGAPYGDRTVSNCLLNCRCLPECSYMKAINQVDCLWKKMSKRDWIQSLRDSVAQGTNELLDTTISNTTTPDTTDMTLYNATDMAPNNTTDMTPNNPTENALFSNYYLWCGTIPLTLDCENPPNNYECATNGAPYGDRTVRACLLNCRCMPECSYTKAIYAVTCVGGSGGVGVSKRDWSQSLRDGLALPGANELLSNTLSNTTTPDTTDMAPNTTAPDTTTDMTPTNNTTENALFNKYYVWCESVYLTGQCTAAPGNFYCTPEGIPMGDRSVGNCRNNCRCLPECSYMQAMFAVVCAVGAG